MQKQRVTISLACYNKLEFTKQCLEYLYKNTPHDLFDLIIVDNASTDGTKDWLIDNMAKELKIDQNHNYTLLINDKNIGFSRAHNQSFKECKTEYFLPLNNDTVPCSGWLEPLIRDLDEDKTVGAIGCKLISPLVQGIQHCLLPNEKIITNNGEKEISNIKINDYVLTHSGVFKKVLNIFKRKYKGNFIKIYPNYRLPLIITEEHPIAILKKKNILPIWHKANLIEKDDMLIFPIIKDEICEKEIMSKFKKFLNTLEISKFANKKIYDLDKNIILQKDFWRLIGYWLAEGSLSKHSNGNGFNVRWTFNKKEKEFIGDINKIVKMLLKRNTYIENNISTNSVTINITSKILYLFLEEYFGKGAINKKIPMWCESLPLKYQKELLKGYFRGDGGYVNNLFKVTSISINLLNSIQRILLRFKTISSLNLKRKDNKAVIRDRMINQNISYNLIFDAEKAVKILDDKKIFNIKRYNKKAILTENNLYIPIRKTEIIYKENEVYNIEVADDNSYCCNLISLHNCGVIFRKDGTPIHRYFGIQPTFRDVNKKAMAPAVTGASIIIRSDIYKEVNGFDEIYRNGWEDIDFCLKIREKGWQILYEPASELYHYEGQTEGRMDNDNRNRLIFMDRWYSKIMQWGNIDYNEWKKEQDKIKGKGKKS